MSGATNTSRLSTPKSTSPLDAEILDSEGLPEISERLDEFREMYPELSQTLVVQEYPDDPRESVKLRRDAAMHRPTVHKDTITEGVFRPVKWVELVRRHLEWFDGVRDLEGRFSDGVDEWSTRFLNSYHPEYLETYYAQFMGLHREIEAEYSDPHTAMLSLTASGRDGGDGPIGPVDHQLMRREAWQPTYKRLYDRMEALVDSGQIDEWMYLVVEEHHPGGGLGLNAGYGHDHVVVITDGAVDESDFFDVVDAWVDSCDGAEFDAHDYRHPVVDKRPVKVREIDSEGVDDPDKIHSAAGYLTKYLYPDDGEADPLERDIEQLAHHAVKWATNTRRVRKSDRAGAAISADLCRQSFEDPDRSQEFDHGEKLQYKNVRGASVLVCACCESAWGIAGDTFTENRLKEERDASRSELELSERQVFRGRWESAKGGSMTSSDGGVVGFEYSLTAPRLVGYRVGGEEFPANKSGGGVETVPVRPPPRDQVREYTSPTGEVVRELKPSDSGPLSHEDFWAKYEGNTRLVEMVERAEDSHKVGSDHSTAPPPSQGELIGSVLSVLRESREPLSVVAVAARRTLEPGRVESVIEKLSSEGRVMNPDGDGWVVV